MIFRKNLASRIPQHGRAPALADKIPPMMPEARVAQTVTGSEAVRLASEIFSFVVSAKSLPGEYDDNFLLTSADGREFVLKIMHPARDQSFVEMQCQALQHLAKRAPQLSLPRVCQTQSGEAFTIATLSDGSERLVWLLTCVRGTVLAKVNPTLSRAS